MVFSPRCGSRDETPARPAAGAARSPGRGSVRPLGPVRIRNGPLSLRAASPLNPEADRLAQEAESLRAAGGIPEAIDRCRKALAIEPDCLAAHRTWARALRPGMDFLAWLGWFHDHVSPRLYLEIGVDVGRTLSLASPPTVSIGVDPACPEHPPAFRASTRLFRMTSDDFFASSEATALAPFDLAFIDGLHLFEQALRDFGNVERRSRRSSVVLMHDCLPLDAATSSRRRRTGFWSGDVWKVIPALRQWRPDLSVSVLPAFPTGLAVVTGLDPSSRVIEERFEEIVAPWIEAPWDDRRAREWNVVDNSPEAIGRSWFAQG